MSPRDDLSTNCFYGVQLYKSVNGATPEEKEEGAALFRATKLSEDNRNVVSVAKNFAENIENKDPQKAKTVTYSLKGYVWQASSEYTKYQFNTFEDTGGHNSEGKSVLTTQISRHKLDDEKK